MIKEYKDNNMFLNEYLTFLEMDDIKNNLIIGIAKKAIDKDAYFVSSVIGDHILLGVIMGRKMIITANTLDEDVYVDLVKHMEKIAYPGIIGERLACLTYQRVFEKNTQRKMSIEMNQKIYKCERAKSNLNSENNIRLAARKDIDILFTWYKDFITTLEGPTSDDKIKRSLLHAIENQNLFVMENEGEIVSMTAKTRETKNSQTVAMVYTPTSHRAKGFATKLVSEVTSKILENKRYATLYTDASNPTSNSIYMKIGYELYCESLMMVIH